MLGAGGRDELNDNDKLLLTFDSDSKLAPTNTLFSTRRGGIYNTFNGIGNRNDRNLLSTSQPAKKIDIAYLMLGFTPNIHLHPKMIQIMTSCT